MERKVLSFVLVCVVIGLQYSGKSEALFKDFGNCMKECLIICAIPPWNPVCPASCMAKCIILPVNLQSTNRFCTLGCATSICSKIIAQDDPHLDEVKSCVNLCSGSCNKN